MLDFMKMRAEHHGKGEAGEVSLTPMNLTTMLSNANSATKRSWEQSLSPHSPVSGRSGGLHHSSRDLDNEHVDSSNNRSRNRRSSGDREIGDRDSVHHPHQPMMKDLQSQFFAYLKRLGASSNIPTQSTNSQQDTQAATPSSTTHSPPLNAPGTPSKMEEENLPPRKRKVSQEHQKSPYNGLHEVERPPAGSNGPTSAPPQPPSVASSENNDNSVECRN